MINIDNDVSVLTKGVWVTFGGSQFLIAHMSNVGFTRAVMRGQAPYRKKIEAGSLDPAISREIMTKAMSTHLVLDWKDVVDSNGDQVQFSSEACYKALSNNEDLRDFVSEFAMNLDNYKKEEKDALGKS